MDVESMCICVNRTMQRMGDKRCGGVDGGVCENHHPFAQTFTMQHNSRNCSPTLDLVLWRLILPYVFFYGGVFCSETPVWNTLRVR